MLGRRPSGALARNARPQPFKSGPGDLHFRPVPSLFLKQDEKKTNLQNLRSTNFRPRLGSGRCGISATATGSINEHHNPRAFEALSKVFFFRKQNANRGEGLRPFGRTRGGCFPKLALSKWRNGFVHNSQRHDLSNLGPPRKSSLNEYSGVSAIWAKPWPALEDLASIYRLMEARDNSFTRISPRQKSAGNIVSFDLQKPSPLAEKT